MIADKMLNKIDEMQNPCVVGLDPVIESVPKHLLKGDSFEDVADAFRQFNYAIIDEIADIIPIVKPQMAFYEKYGAPGVQAFKDTVDYAHSKGMIVIEDGKRNDIASTAQAYADGHLGVVQTEKGKRPSMDVDLLTVNPYLGTDGLNPFVSVCKEFGKGIFILVKTSNPSSGELQDRYIEINADEEDQLVKFGIEVKDHKTMVYNLIALQVNKYAQADVGERGYSGIGAVVGATYPSQAEELRKIMPKSIFLVPGYGAQGGKSQDLVNCFNKDGYGAVVNSSRGIIFAYSKEEPLKFAEVAREAALTMIKDIRGALKDNGKYPVNWKD